MATDAAATTRLRPESLIRSNETNKKSFFCNKCGLTKAGSNFYTYRSGEKAEICKSCLTMHIDNFDEKTYTWILEKLDYPYLPRIWNEIREKRMKQSPNKPLSTVSVIGKYISSMKLNQYSEYGYADSEFLQAEEERKANASKRSINVSFGSLGRDELDKLYSDGKINEAEYKTFASPESADDARFYTPAPLEDPNPYAPDSTKAEEFDQDLTEDDKRYLSIKWGRLYKPAQWVKLEESYRKMNESFDIRDADTIATLELLCKTQLKMNEAIDLGDVDSFRKLSGVYDSLRKSAKFTAFQNKDKTNNSVDSVGELVAMCEKDGGFIPKFCLDIPQDKLDATIMDMKKYTHDLVTNEMGLGKQIEEAILQIQLQQKEDEKDIMDYEEEVLNDADFHDYFDTIDLDREEGSGNGTS